MTAGYRPGESWLVATPQAMAFVGGSDAEAVLLWRVLSGAPSAAAAAGLLLESALRDGAAGLAGLGAFVLAIREASGVRVLCREVDDVAVWGADGTVTVLAGSGLVGWAEALFPLPCTVTIGDPAGGRDGDLLPVPGGVVRAAAVRWEPAGAPVPSPALAAPLPDPAAPPASRPLPDPAALSDPPPPSDLPARIVEWTPAVEETRYELGVDLDDIPGDDPPDRSASETDPAHRATEVADPAGGSALRAPTQPPITAVPRADPGTEPAGSWPLPAEDHDGLTQLAEDLPIGFTPPPTADEEAPGTVLAVLCPSGHANAPHSTTCRLCGQPVGMTEPIPVQRPVLARVRLSTGQVVDLDRPLVVGRAPSASRVPAPDLPHLVTVPSPHQDISRTHVQLRVVDWQLLVTDLDSTNGTTIRCPGRPPQRLRPGQEVVVQPGWLVELGDGVSLVIEALS